MSTVLSICDWVRIADQATNLYYHREGYSEPTKSRVFFISVLAVAILDSLSFIVQNRPFEIIHRSIIVVIGSLIRQKTKSEEKEFIFCILSMVRLMSCFCIPSSFPLYGTIYGGFSLIETGCRIYSLSQKISLEIC